MARGRRRRPDRDDPQSLADRLDRPLGLDAVYSPFQSPYDDFLEPDLSLSEDRRLYHPDGFVRPAASVRTGRPAAFRESSWKGVGVRPRTLGGKARQVKKVRHAQRFNVPDDVAVCVRRRMRREVLHALRKTRGGAGSRKRRNFWSGVYC